MLVGTLRDFGHEPVAILGPRAEPSSDLALGPTTAPPGVDLLAAGAAILARALERG